MKSPNTEAAVLTGLIASAVVAYLVSNPSAGPINSDFIDKFVDNVSKSAGDITNAGGIGTVSTQT